MDVSLGSDEAACDIISSLRGGFFTFFLRTQRFPGFMLKKSITLGENRVRREVSHGRKTHALDRRRFPPF